MAERSVTLSIPVVLSSSEMVNPDLFDRVATMLGGQLIDFYGQGERVAFAHATCAGRYCFNPLYGSVELSPLEESAPDPEYSSFAIIATGHWNSAMPLVRYETGDIALVSKADLSRLSDIERGDHSFAGLLGRQSEFILGPEGEVVSGLNHVPRGVGGLIRAQIVQTAPTQVEIRAQASPAFDDDSVATLLQNARRIIPASVEIRIEVCDQLERASNNKIPFVIRRL
jgi:phenylacetate-CoA ligase